MSAQAFSTGQRFRFFDSQEVYTFQGLSYNMGVSEIWYYDSEERLRSRKGVGLLDLVHV